MANFPPKNRKPVTMRWLSVGACLLLPISAIAEIDSVFTVPPYALHETVVGIDGWEMRHKEPYPVYTDPNAATIIESPIIGSTQLTTLDLRTLLKNSAVDELGEHFVVEAQFAISFNPNTSFDGGLYFRFSSTESASPFHFGFYYGEGGGFYYQAQEEKVILLPKAEIQQDGAYKFTFDVDRGAGVFHLTVTCANDEAFRYEARDVAFQEGSSLGTGKFKEFFMGNNKPATTKAYIDYVKISPFKE